jgi:hypothetical protein
MNYVTYSFEKWHSLYELINFIYCVNKYDILQKRGF